MIGFRLWFHPPWRECVAFRDVVRLMKRPAIGRELRNIAGPGRELPVQEYSRGIMTD